MTESLDIVQQGRERQKVKEEAVHSWYRFVLAYPDHLIDMMLDKMKVERNSLVLDPFCGTGTTLVECKKRGIDSVGIDANPASVFASRVKCDWGLDPNRVKDICTALVAKVRPVSDALLLSDIPLFATTTDVDPLKKELLDKSKEGQYLLHSGMIGRQWIDEVPFYIAIALLTEINRLPIEKQYSDLLRLALVAVVVEAVANIRFGPELYVVKNSGNHDVLSPFISKVNIMVADLRAASGTGPTGSVQVIHGDSRACDSLLHQANIGQIDYVITSPPYPTEKDYTRNTRLELVFLGFIHDNKSLRQIKRQMIRSHSKGIYKGDEDGKLVSELPYVKSIVDELREKCKYKTYGFAKLYPRIIEEYFGGMYRHFQAISKVLRPGGKAAYVVGEQCTYLQTFTPTGSILAKLAERPELGFKVHNILTWRVRQGTTGSGDTIKEEILIIEKI